MTAKPLSPIDIPLKNLLEGLIDRKIVSPHWQDQLRPVKAAIAEALDALPIHAKDVVAGKAADDVLYYDCKALLTHLEASDEAKATNFFGQYTSPVLKAWMAITKAYEVHALFAAEAARRLNQDATFEIPALRKAIALHEKHVGDNHRKIADYTKGILECNRAFAAACADLQIPGFDIRLELQALVYDLPSLFRGVAGVLNMPTLRDAGAYHAALQAHLHAASAPALSSLDAFWAAPLVVEPTGVAPSAPSEVVEIQWDANTIELSDGGIDWGNDDAVVIDWDISSVKTQDVPSRSSELATTQVDQLLHGETRAKLTNDLLELRAFLLQRRMELQTPDVAFANQFQTSAPLLAQQSVESTKGYLAAVDAALAALREKRLQHVLLIKLSPRYLDRLVVTLELHMTKAEKLHGAIRALEDKNSELTDLVATSHAQIRALMTSTKSLQKQLETSLPALFKGHPVHILGELNRF
ncbi:hypothetical protein SPRG_01555 [Saprolegnia parasitica CBS 223.65]|uniref:CDK5RAP3-like protein n=1 Tax=Saprolegnia parasitica (strain CBS 223.65) TaxID=695850 RepID=A0A067CYS9_SAPPC|nr:hypothetical protein SPRG_01555 [Saprolegnia parasitica CBS 223.65]KDO34420.1 hypothetical protein SPRG_01555 [Saprolegnia parasitica CBS 223.65]|eukprot:XP_012195151.1 hypothetical protein SPRG_01555 [Saprolegnia parasitica CBS 223.65]